MSQTINVQQKPVNTSKIIEKGVPTISSVISIISSIIILIGFALPWVSCGSYKLSGIDITQKSLSGELEDTRGAFLFLIPSLAFIIIGVSIGAIPLTFWSKIPKLIKTLAFVLVSLLSTLACCPASLFIINLQSSHKESGGFIQIEYGFWLSCLGILSAFAGGILGTIFSLFKRRHAET